GIARGDDAAVMERMAHKLCKLRIFGDAEGKMNLSVADIGGGVLCVPNFTVCGDTARGHRPSFEPAERPEAASGLFDQLCEAIAAQGVMCARGVFGAVMKVSLLNDGPVTVVIEVGAG
ncbi:MAG: D-tyrosyl-tRNA(Tyr) deacylase, partial [Phycisphaerales bacterium]|nr:D-tyrosyl-tRNA(Tyr) deacylase [Phycisphaerales bacterium]